MRNRRRDFDIEAPRRFRWALWITLTAVGSVVAITCCCGGLGVMIYNNEAIMTRGLIGTWTTPDGTTTLIFRPNGKLKRNGLDLTYKVEGANILEVGPDLTGKHRINGQPHPTIMYHIDYQALGNSMVLTEVTPPVPGVAPEVLVLDRK